MLPPNFDEVIEIKGERVTEAQIAAFKLAVRADAPGFPPTFPTVYRVCEFKWLDRLEADMRNLLHTDQDYQYLVPLQAGDEPLISTRFVSYRERKGTHFITLETKVSCGQTTKVLSTTSFVIREEEKK